jgi:hypothetical protein
MHRNKRIIEVTIEISDNWILLHSISKKLRYGEYFSIIV